MMSMTFHFGFKETILFDFWQTDSIAIFLLSCFILFVFAALYEGLKLIREKLIRDEIVRKQQVDVIRANAITSSCQCDISKSAEQKSLLAGNGKTSGAAAVDEEAGVQVVTPHECCKKQNASSANNTTNPHTSTRIVEDDESKLIVMKSYRTSLLSSGHIIQTFLHMLQITVSYLLMLVFMTYNTWLCLSVVLGAGLGYFIFGLKRLTAIDVNEHCH